MGSRRQYVTAAEVLALSGYTVTDNDISVAEELIDSFIGYTDQFFSIQYSYNLEGLCAGVGSLGSNLSMVLEARHQNISLMDFFTFCEVEIIGGAGQGQRSIIKSSTYPNTEIQLRDAFTIPIDTTSFYRIYQLGKFPRREDVFLDAIHTPNRYYKNIPEALKRATAAQVEYMKTMPSQFFQTDDLFKDSEKIGDYAYTKVRSGAVGLDVYQMISPKAKALLRGYTNRKGEMLV